MRNICKLYLLFTKLTSYLYHEVTFRFITVNEVQLPPSNASEPSVSSNNLVYKV